MFQRGAEVRDAGGGVGNSDDRAGGIGSDLVFHVRDGIRFDRADRDRAGHPGDPLSDIHQAMIRHNQ